MCWCSAGPETPGGFSSTFIGRVDSVSLGLLNFFLFNLFTGKIEDGNWVVLLIKWSSSFDDHNFKASWAFSSSHILDEETASEVLSAGLSSVGSSSLVNLLVFLAFFFFKIASGKVFYSPESSQTRRSCP